MLTLIFLVNRRISNMPQKAAQKHSATQSSARSTAESKEQDPVIWIEEEVERARGVKEEGREKGGSALSAPKRSN